MYQLIVAFQLFFAGHSIERFEEENIPPGKLQCCREAFNIWLPKASRTAIALWMLTVMVFFSGFVVGIVEEIDILWIASLPVMALLLLAALVASVLAYRENRDRQGRPDDSVV